MGGGAGVSIHDEQEIERLRASSDELRDALAVSERQLIDAMALLADSKPGKPDMLSCQIWRQRLARLQHEYRHGAL
jgi:hypothetical protein